MDLKSSRPLTLEQINGHQYIFLEHVNGRLLPLQKILKLDIICGMCGEEVLHVLGAMPHVDEVLDERPPLRHE